LYHEIAISLRVRYSETDQMGIVYYANYLTWFEIGRTEYCRALGIPYTKWEEEGVLLPVVEASCRYLSPARYDDNLTVTTWVEEIKVSSMRFGYRIEREEDKKTLAEGTTRHAFVDKEGKLLRRKHPFYLWIQKLIEEK
jgi:acyl-CoA thioester hydrolase